MSSSTHVVVLGAGVVGASVAYHLAELGWTDVVVIDKGSIPATGGSSSHAPGLAFQTNPSRMMTQLARYTVELYMSLEHDEPTFLQVGGIEVATTRQSWRELQCKHGLATSWGLDAELLSPDEVAARVPLVDPGRIDGGYFVPTDGLVKSVRGVDAMLRHAERKGVQLLGETEVTGFDLRDGRVRAVRTTAGDIVTPIVVCCAGIWGPKVGRMAGVSIPVQPLAHQYAWTTPIAQLAGAADEATYPILRHQDVSMYMRQSYDTYGVGSYQDRAIPIRAGDLPPPEQSTGSGALCLATNRARRCRDSGRDRLLRRALPRTGRQRATFRSGDDTHASLTHDCPATAGHNAKEDPVGHQPSTRRAAVPADTKNAILLRSSRAWREAVQRVQPHVSPASVHRPAR
jgi:glycine/D-amino acid oxidase-like deaminating enzyme